MKKTIWYYDQNICQADLYYRHGHYKLPPIPVRNMVISHNWIIQMDHEFQHHQQ